MTDQYKPGNLSATSSNDKEVVTDKHLVFNYNLSEAPRGKKLIVLNCGGCAIWGMITGNPKRDVGIVAWFPCPVRDKEEEALRFGR